MQSSLIRLSSNVILLSLYLPKQIQLKLMSCCIVSHSGHMKFYEIQIWTKHWLVVLGLAVEITRCWPEFNFIRNTGPNFCTFHHQWCTRPTQPEMNSGYLTTSCNYWGGKDGTGLKLHAGKLIPNKRKKRGISNYYRISIRDASFPHLKVPQEFKKEKKKNHLQHCKSHTSSCLCTKVHTLLYSYVKDINCKVLLNLWSISEAKAWADWWIGDQRLQEGEPFAGRRDG